MLLFIIIILAYSLFWPLKVKYLRYRLPLIFLILTGLLLFLFFNMNLNIIGDNLWYFVMIAFWLILRLVITLYKITLYKSVLNAADWKLYIIKLVIIKLTILTVIYVARKANLGFGEIILILYIAGDSLVVLINCIEELASLPGNWFSWLANQIVLIHQNFYDIVRNILREIINRISGEKMYQTGQDNNSSFGQGSKVNNIHFMNSSGVLQGGSNSGDAKIPVDPVLLGKNQEVASMNPTGGNDQEIPSWDHKLGHIWYKLHTANYQVTVVEKRSFMKFADRITYEEFLYLKQRYQTAYPNCPFSHKMGLANKWSQVGVFQEYIDNIRDLAYPDRYRR